MHRWARSSPRGCRLHHSSVEFGNPETVAMVALNLRQHAGT